MATAVANGSLTDANENAGVVLKIRVENFMCHAHLEMEFNTRVNFITGQNGSGKSAILTALCVAFGVKARATQRATAMRDFIRKGCSYALVCVELQNTGHDAYKHDVYGDKIVVERRILDSGTSTFAIRDCRGKKIAERKEELQNIVDHFNIEVNNPCVIMTQDKSREFLHSGTDKDKFKVFIDAVAAAKAQQEAAEAERQRLANEAAAQAQQTAEADAAARDQRNAASTESLIHSGSQWTTFLQGMIFVPSDAQADPTPAEAERTHLANLMLGMMRGIMWNNTLLQAHLRTERQQRQKYQQDIVVLTTAIHAEATQQQQQHQLLNSALARINSIEANASAAPGCTTDAPKQLNERIDHVVTIIGDIGVFTGPDTISSTVAAIKTDITKLQTRLDAATKTYKMPHFDISKFDDYNKSDALTWWQRFLTEASCRTVLADDMMKALYLQLIGGAQAWMNHLAATNKCTIAKVHTHITWKEFEKLWFTRFMVRNVVKAAMNEVYTCSRGNMPTRDWTTKWQKIVTTLGFDLSFPNQQSEFFSRSCAGLRSTLGNEYDDDTFQAILDRANLVIQTDDKAANKRQSQPHYVAKQGYQRPAHNNVVISEETDDLHAAATSSSDGGIVAALRPKRPKRVRKNKATQETTSTGTGQHSWTAYKITKDVYDFRQNVLIYLDDILVYSRTLDEHIVHLRFVLHRLRLAKYKVNLDKCEFAKQELEYLGHFVRPKGIRPLADKIQAIVDWPEPRCTTDVRSFMGLAGYYQRFVESYSKVAAPLSRLQSPKVPFEFDDAARGAFTTLKAAMQAAPALRIYDSTLPTQVTTDASGYGIGAVLEQCHEDGWHPVEYFSQKVPLVNTLDGARKKKLLAFVTVLKWWRHFLLGRRRFKWNTDNNPLTFYKTQDTVTSTIGRWMYYIDQFDFDPCHIPGPANRAPDALSRRPDFCAVVTTTFDLDDDLQPHFVKGYKSDPTYSKLYAELSSDHPPASHYRISDGFLLLHTRGKDLLVVPQDRILRTRLLGEFHDARLSAHLGFFFEATMLQQVTMELDETKEKIELGEDLIRRWAKDDLEPLRTELTALDAQLKEAQEITQLQSEIESLKKKLAWSYVYKKDAEIAEAIKKIQELEERVVIVQQKILDEEEKRKQAEEVVEAKRLEIEQTRGETSLQEKRDVFKKQLMEAAQKVSRFTSDIENRKKRIENLNRQIAHQEQKIRRVRERMVQESQAETSEREKRIAEKQAKVENLTAELNRLITEERACEERIQDVQAAMEPVALELEEHRSRIKDYEGMIRRMRAQQENRVTGFGRNVPGLLREIERRKRNFHRQPIGPIGSLVSLLDPNWAQAIEVALGRALEAFIVHDHHDAKALRECAKSSNNHQLAIYISEFDEPMCVGVEGEFINPPSAPEEDYAMHLVSSIGIERQVLMATYNDAKPVAWRRGPTKIKECFTADGTRMFLRGNQEVVLNTDAKNPRLGVDLGQLLQQAEEKKGGTIQAASGLESRKRALNEELTAARGNLHAAKRRKQELSRRVDVEKIDLAELEKAAREEARKPPDMDVDLMEEEIASHRRDIEELQSPLEELHNECAKAKEAHDDARNQIDKTHDEAIAQKNISETLEKELMNLQQSVDEAKRDAAHYKRFLSNDLQKQITEVKAKEDVLKKERAEIAAKAAQFCDEEEVAMDAEAQNSPERLKERIQRLQTRAQREEKRVLGNSVSLDTLVRTHDRLKKRVDRLEANISRQEENLKHMAKSLQLRLRRLQKTAKNMARQVEWGFRTFLHGRGYTGTLEVDYQKQEMKVEVQMPGNANSARDTKALSGGERSFATLAYALTLHELVEAPFRAMDEFDIFMDSVSRRISLKKVVDFAIENGNQWIFITPHDISSIQPGPYVKKQQMHSPRP
ncbi:hypothetical protein CBR_g34600 [Chara braunii]|uniref:RecF/RecN/SMC N-terminal domain-containing protein n=1 Tax=Chara braunii TaxID=69332 RepID=A0A388LJ17_CHABU|nr:hypothetical protein CBR_g34600 [Chara braunii]|eukprot:GBG82316.1 hypothetical protein CBR_g34600 [Chara braunii]